MGSSGGGRYYAPRTDEQTDSSIQSARRATESADYEAAVSERLRDLLADYKKERVATASAWRGLLSTMASTRKEKPSPIAKAEAKALAATGEKTPAKRGRKRRKKRRG